MAWSANYLRTFFHGTTLDVADDIANRRSPISLHHCAPNTDFGKGFYLTSSEHQARNWANYRHDPNKPPLSSNIAAVLCFRLDTEDLGALIQLSMAWEGKDTSSDFWEFVAHCRNGGTHLNSRRRPDQYDMVCGPVTVWKQYLVIGNSDQFSFHSQAAIDLLNNAIQHNRCSKVAWGDTRQPLVPL